MAVKNFNNTAYGLSSPLLNVFPEPIIANRVPTANDQGELGQVWIDKTDSSAFMLVSIVANSYNWVSMVAGGTGMFTSLDVDPGDITVDQGDIDVTLGDVNLGAGNILLDQGSIEATLGGITAKGPIFATNGNLEAADIANDATGPEVVLLKQRAGAIVQADDSLGAVSFNGYDGTNYLEAARIEAFAKSPASGSMPTDLAFSVWTDDEDALSPLFFISNTDTAGMEHNTSANDMRLVCKNTGTTKAIVIANSTTGAYLETIVGAQAWSMGLTNSGTQDFVIANGDPILGLTNVLVVNGSTNDITLPAGDLSLSDGSVDIHSNTAAATASEAALLKSRTGGVITTGDALGSVNFYGYDGTAYIKGASITSNSSGTIAANRIPADLEFYTHPDSTAAAVKRLTIATTGTVQVAQPDTGNSIELAGTGSSVTVATTGTNVSLHLNSVGTGGTGQTRGSAGQTVELFNVNTDNTNGASASLVSSTVGGSSAGDAKFQALISGGQAFTWGIDNSTTNDDFVISRSATLGTTNVLSIDGSSGNVSVINALSNTAGNITSAARFVVGGTGGPQIVAGAGDPNGTITSPVGSLYLNTTGSGVADRAWINTNGGTVWTAISTVA